MGKIGNRKVVACVPNTSKKNDLCPYKTERRLILHINNLQMTFLEVPMHLKKLKLPDTMHSH
jgi:hypothetical protein